MPASLGATTGRDLDLDIINAPLSPRETIKTGHGKATANIINTVHLCSVQWREGWSGCSHTPGDPQLGDVDVASAGRWGLQGAVWHIRLAGSREVPRLELTGTRPEKVSSILASCSCHCPVVSARREERFLGRGEHVGVVKGPFLEVT